MDRLDWKACAQSGKDDALDAQNFKMAFAEFDEMKKKKSRIGVYGPCEENLIHTSFQTLLRDPLLGSGVFASMSFA